MSAFTVTTDFEGNLTEDPILRYTANDNAVCNMRVAASNRRRNTDGTFTEVTEFVNVVAWRQLAEHAAFSLRKGARIIVSGNLKNRTYEDREGNTRYVTEIHATQVGISLRWHVVGTIQRRAEAFGEVENTSNELDELETIDA